jgi:hypothetical protein
MCAKIIGHIPDSEQYLVGSDDFPIETGDIPPEGSAARILDMDRDVLFEPQDFQTITAQVPRFTDYDGDDDLTDIMSDPDADITVLGPSLDETPAEIPSE